MKRPKQHRLEEESRNYVRGVLPVEWIKRDMFPDYGEDLLIQVVTGDQVTGDYLMLQVKATERAATQDGFVAVRLEVRSLEYLATLRIPAVLVAYDALTRTGYWVFVHEYVHEILDAKKPHWRTRRYVKLQIPSSQRLSDSQDQLALIARTGPLYLLKNSLKASMDWLAALRLSGGPDDIERIGRELLRRKKEDHAMRIHLGLLDLRHGATKEGYDALVSVVMDTRETDPDLFAQAVAGLVGYHNPVDEKGNRAIVDLAAAGAEAAKQVGNARLEAFLSASLGEAIHIALARRAGHVLFSREFSRASGLAWTATLLDQALQIINERMKRVGQYFQRALTLSSAAQDGYILATVTLKLAETQLNLYATLLPFASREELKEVAAPARSLLDFVGKLASRADDPELSAYWSKAEGQYSYLTGDADGAVQAYSRAESSARGANLSGLLASLSELQEMTKQRPDPKAIQIAEGEEPSPEDERRAVEWMLEAWGVNLSGDDTIAYAARIGLADLNPGRVFEWCEHIHAQVLGVSFVGHLLGLPIGQKVLYCPYGGVTVDLSLDRALADFKEKFCNGCSYLSPRAAGWKWSHKWSRERGIPPEMQKAMDNLRGSR